VARGIRSHHCRRRNYRSPVPVRRLPPFSATQRGGRRVQLGIAACLLAFLVWFFGFMVVAGEWFAMWQSATWNGQEAAFRFYVAVLGVQIFVNQPDADL
jgi:predicted small integral membrane protein